jgi:Flp pilus assembly protein TadD
MMPTKPTATEMSAAKSDFDKSPNDFAAAYTYGAMLLVIGDASAAELPLGNAAAHIDDRKGEAASLLGTARSQRGAFAAAAEAWSLVLQKRPTDKRALIAAAAACGSAGDVLQALAHKRVLAAVADDAASWSDLGASLNRAGQHAEAVTAFAHAEQLDSSFFARAAYESSLRQQSLTQVVAGAS